MRAHRAAVVCVLPAPLPLRVLTRLAVAAAQVSRLTART